MGKVVSVNVSDKRGVRKTPVESIEVRPGFGVVGDAHAGRDPVREISLLAMESVEKMRNAGLNVAPGDFGENITVSGVEIFTLPVGTVLKLGEVRMEVTQIGKTCVKRCAIYYQAGDCVMPREGIFAKALNQGWISPGDPFEIEIKK